ncbi:hypothetical protein ACFVU2_03475 [Leifsonia sp. NPDC058194]|uniref:hypothetical protein n=1 Tax=Leifsonia sp. NPDC058194 TaxID=3346374 RepID=UPI0036DBCD18
MADLTSSEVARRIAVGERYVRELLTERILSGRRLPSGEWLIDSDSVARFEVSRRPAGRALSPGAAWAVVFELSGVRPPTPLPSATYARVRQRIRASSALTLSLVVAGRTKRHQYRSANSALAQAGLIATARAASGAIDSGLLSDDRRVAGYVPIGVSVEDYARSHFMVPDPAGPDTLYENTAPGGLTAVLPGVVAADLSVSTDQRERGSGLRVLDELRDAWLQAHTR